MSHKQTTISNNTGKAVSVFYYSKLNHSCRVNGIITSYEGTIITIAKPNGKRVKIADFHVFRLHGSRQRTEFL